MNALNISAGAAVAVLSPKQQNKLQHLTAIPGAGKTHAYCLDVAQRVGDRFIIACISKVLAEEVATTLMQRGEDVRLIMDGENKKFREVARVTTALRSAIVDCDTRILVVTHAAIELLGEIIYTDDKLRSQMPHWNLIVDEMPSARKDVKTGKVDVTRPDLFPWLQYCSLDDTERFLIATDTAGLTRCLFDTRHKALVIALLNGEKIKVQYRIGNIINFRSRARSDLYALAVLAKSFLYAADNASDTPFVKVSQKIGYEWEESKSITVDPSREHYHNTGRVQLASFCESASKSRLAPKLEEMARSVAETLQLHDRPFIYACNNDEPGEDGVKWKSVFSKHLDPIGGINVSFKSFGYNHFKGFPDAVEVPEGVPLTLEQYRKGIDTAVWLGMALHGNDMIELVGKDEVQSDNHFNTAGSCVQMVCRGAIRNIDDHQSEFYAFTLTDIERDHLKQKYFPDAQIMPVTRVELQKPKTTAADKVYTKGAETRQKVWTAAERVRDSGVKKVTARLVQEVLKGQGDNIGSSQVAEALKLWKEREAEFAAIAA